ncbi:uncharacterized protein MELLADRAFT_85135 [Melampsora larici-populina 98AG31]|uniref:Uncharacterized protein n=1 Tax=Melampsora larici-populina (strain 98AG31 / pathotype 3-4-7) TaxID=747676 RepID=F4RHM2_MELLP|nr:uncharacterized protein MELLADRAFT_85135 [Melampsora larici-populina 98AG31]EGG08111.1 hypothetical protein MELLADRAFT_85135 [Melampsora larici-populina 98AG31]
MVRNTQSGTNTCGRGGRGRSRQPHLNGSHGSDSDSDQDGSDYQAPLNEDEDDEDQVNEDKDRVNTNQDNLRDLANMRSQPPACKRSKPNQGVEKPTLQNYRELGSDWGKSKAETILAAQPRTNNRLSPNGLLEAQALQSKYDLDKTMLALALGCSRSNLDEAIFEGPLGQEPHGYTNYQTYSNTATKTNMPPKGTSRGFGNRNVIVGNTWSDYTKDQKTVFSPIYFERLSKACLPTSTSTQINTNNQPDHQSAVPPEDPLTDEELEKYVPIFKELANLTSIARDFKHGYLSRHSAKQWSREELMKAEVKKVVKQQFKLQFHLFLGCWNPNNKGPRALYEDEYMSCEQWAVSQRKEQRLLECFVHTATHAPLSVRTRVNNTQTLSAAAIAQQNLRSQLSEQLNSLVHAHLVGPFTVGDSHPKVPNPHLALAKKKFRGNVKLAVQLSPDCKIDATLLAKGATAGALKNHEIQMWLDDIQTGRYQVVKTNTPLSDPNPI